MNSDKASTLPLILLIGIFLATLTPFLFQPLHNDDPFWIKAALEAANHPLTPLKGEIDWAGLSLDLFEYSTHPPLYTLYLALLLALTGESSLTLLHLGSALFPLIAVLSMFYLSRRFTPSPFAATAAFLGAPAFMVMSHNFHHDIPNLALLLTAFTAYVYGEDRRSRGLTVLSGVAMGLAILTTYQSAFFLFILPLYTFLQRGSFRERLWAYLIPVVMLALWFLHNLFVHGEIHLLALSGGNAGGITAAKAALHAMMIACHLGGALLFPPLLALCWIKRGFSLYLYLACFLLGSLFIFGHPLNGFQSHPLATYNALHRALFILFFSSGLFVLISLTLPALKLFKERDSHKDELFLSAWLLSYAAVALVGLPFISARYLLPILPPLVILAFRALERRKEESPRFFPLASRALPALSLATGLAVSIADYETASLYKELPEKLKLHIQRPKVWGSGITDFLYYFDKEGIPFLKRPGEGPSTGDIVIQSKNLIAADPFPKELEQRLRLRNVIDVEGHWPLRTLDYASHAGFYVYVWGFLPYSISREPLDQISIFEVIEKREQ